MHIIYLIVAPPQSERFADIEKQLQEDIAAGHDIGQLFFYSDAVALGTLVDYPLPAEVVIDLAESHHISLHLCSAAFQKRDYQLSALGKQDFTFKGLGQFIAESQHTDILRLF